MLNLLLKGAEAALRGALCSLEAFSRWPSPSMCVEVAPQHLHLLERGVLLHAILQHPFKRRRRIMHHRCVSVQLALVLCGTLTALLFEATAQMVELETKRSRVALVERQDRADLPPDRRQLRLRRQIRPPAQGCPNDRRAMLLAGAPVAEVGDHRAKLVRVPSPIRRPHCRAIAAVRYIARPLGEFRSLESAATTSNANDKSGCA